MDGKDLREIQVPLKERYREDSGEAGLHPASGASLGIGVESGEVRAEGDLDFRGTLAVDRDAPVGFAAIRLTFELDTDADEGQVQTLLKLTERYCVVFQTLSTPPQLSATVAAT